VSGFFSFAFRRARFALATAIGVAFFAVGVYADATGEAVLGFESWAWQAVGATIFFVAVLALLYRYDQERHAGVGPPVAPPKSKSPPPTQRSHHYDAVDRQRVRDALRELRDMLNGLSDLHMESHRLADRAWNAIGKPDATATVRFMLPTIREQFAEALLAIGVRFVHGRDDESDEALAILGDRGRLSQAIAAIDGVIKPFSIQAPADDLREVIRPHWAAWSEANSQLGEWINVCKAKVERRRRDLGGG
jgi:hypothetical protein